MFPTLLVAEDKVKNTTIKQYDYWSLKCEVVNDDQNCQVLQTIKTNYINTSDFNQKIRNIKITANSLSKFDIIVLMTDYDTFDYEIIKNYSKFIFDCRVKFQINNKIVRG